MEDDVDNFELWCGAYRDEPTMATAETMRLLLSMCRSGNRLALDYLDALRAGRERLPNDSEPDLLDSLWRDLVLVQSSEPFSLDDLDGEQWGVLIGTLEPRSPATDSLLSEPDDNDYPPNWAELARAKKTERSWRCERCFFQRFYSSLLHVHHVDGDKTDNTSSNLEVLCAICHGQKHGTTPLWPKGVASSEISELKQHHSSWRARQRLLRRDA